MEAHCCLLDERKTEALRSHLPEASADSKSFSEKKQALPRAQNAQGLSGECDIGKLIAMVLNPHGGVQNVESAGENPCSAGSGAPTAHQPARGWHLLRGISGSCKLWP